MLPQVHGAHADQSANRRSQGDRVIGVDDSLGETEDRAGQEQTAAPNEEGRANDVGPWMAEREQQRGAEQNHRSGNQPRNLPTELAIEEAVPHRARPTPNPSTRGAATPPLPAPPPAAALGPPAPHA